MNRAAGHQAWITVALGAYMPPGYEERRLDLVRSTAQKNHSDERERENPGWTGGESVAEMRLLEALGVGGYQQIGTIAPPLKEPAEILAAQFVPLVVV